MQRFELIQRVRSYTRDYSNSIFREVDIVDYINEGINRFKQSMSEFESMPLLLAHYQEVTLIPERYQHLLAIYSASRCFAQDERYNQSSTLMNEFEVKLSEIEDKINSGELIIRDVDGNPVITESTIDYVDIKSYWGKQKATLNLDDGVEG